MATLFEGGVTSRRSVVAEGGESTVVGRAQLREGNVIRRFEDPISDFLL
jgi:hypothetical protein